MTWSIIHPFIVHFALSLAFLFGIFELFPKMKSDIPEPWGDKVRGWALIGLLIAVLTGVATIWLIHFRVHPLLRDILPHPVVALLGTALFCILGLTRGRASTTMNRIMALAGIILLLSAAALGGSLVYEDHLGTDFWHDLR